MFVGANKLAIDLLKKMLTYDPDQRITVEQALKHEYLKQLHYPDDEPSSERVSAFDFDYEKYSLSKEEYKDLIYDEIMLYHSDEAAFNYINMKKENPNGVMNLKFGERLKKAYK